jgi:hypothetical protein
MSIKKTTDKECIEAIDYFIGMDMINNRMNSDERHYCAILIKRVVETLEVPDGK